MAVRVVVAILRDSRQCLCEGSAGVELMGRDEWECWFSEAVQGRISEWSPDHIPSSKWAQRLSCSPGCTVWTKTCEIAFNLPKRTQRFSYLGGKHVLQKSMGNACGSLFVHEMSGVRTRSVIRVRHPQLCSLSGGGALCDDREACARF